MAIRTSSMVLEQGATRTKMRAKWIKSHRHWMAMNSEMCGLKSCVTCIVVLKMK